MRYDLDDRLAFGKHKGRTVEDVMDEDGGAAYLLWCAENRPDLFECDQALQDEITRCARGRR